jgi:hypothetical protein
MSDVNENRNDWTVLVGIFSIKTHENLTSNSMYANGMVEGRYEQNF